VKQSPKPAAFTLVELMVVLAILGILSVAGAFAAKVGTERANAIRCLGSMRDVGKAMQLYIGEHNGRMPDTSHSRSDDGSSLSWTKTLAAYLSGDFISRCPSSKSPSPVTYGWNDLLTDTNGVGIPVMKISRPSTTLVLAEVAESYPSEHFHFAGARTRVTFNQFKSSVAVETHGKGANYLFADGHAENLTPTEIRNRLNAVNSTFLKP
jgi:prepilin-type N-terminal cleavage/methylation domain-containing protein/prepilin-type processing-associated H-X9-DG protein